MVFRLSLCTFLMRFAEVAPLRALSECNSTPENIPTGWPYQFDQGAFIQFVFLKDVHNTSQLLLSIFRTSVSYTGLWSPVGNTNYPMMGLIQVLGSMDGTLSFSQHISKLQAKVKSILDFLYRNCFSFTSAAKLTLIQMTILPMLD